MITAAIKSSPCSQWRRIAWPGRSSPTPDERQRLQQRLQQADDSLPIADAPQPCVLLHEGRCSVYDGRPLICRIQGFPLFSTMIERPDGSQRDCCPLNFSTMSLSEVDSTAIYNLDLVNQTLAAINHLYMKETGQTQAGQHVRMQSAPSRARRSEPALRSG